MPSDQFHDHIAALRALGGQRVWSLMISLFGDLAQAEGDSIDGPVLSAIMAAMLVKPEAVRVALHRLRNDGWIASEKRGRISQHSLTAEGRQQSARASPRIYATPEDLAGDWQLVLTADASIATHDAITKAGYAALMPRVFLGRAGKAVPADAVALPGVTAPDWLRRQIEPAALTPDYEALRRTLDELSRALPAPEEMSALEIAVLRCLIVHNWRRLALKHPALPTSLVTKDWPGHHCHLLVSGLLGRFARPDLAAVSTEIATA
jgi:phenylacetic acid degradation operon negative regulatory protein